MAGFQPARSPVGESVAEFMERRQREVMQLGPDAEGAGREAWAAATRNGDYIRAATTGDVRALGGRVLGGLAAPAAITMPIVTAEASATAPRSDQFINASRRAPVEEDRATFRYGALKANLPTDRELTELRRQQAAFGETTRQIDIQNSWFAAPVLAAPLAIMGLEAAGALAGRALVRPTEEAVLNFVERERYRRVGDNWATRAGRRAHESLEARLDAKDGWNYEPSLPRPGPSGR